MRFPRFVSLFALCAAAGALPSPFAMAADPVRLPVLVPVTGFLALEGTSQRNGALLALKTAPDLARPEVQDTATAPETAVNAFEKALSAGPVPAVVAPMLGTQMLALLPLAAERRVPLVTVSGTAQITEQGNPYVFRFFPGDAVVKQAHARFVVEELKATRPAVIYQTTAYGQSGRQALAEAFKRLGATVAFEEGVAPTVKDYRPVLAKALEARPDALVLHLHAGPTALAIRAAAGMAGVPRIVAGSAMHQPATAALLEPAELKGVCAESGSSPISGGAPALEAWTEAYRAAFKDDPDAFALAQYDGTMMVLAALRSGARSPEQVRDYLARSTHRGLAMTYRSDGKGNMAHDALIICFDGKDRTPRVAKRYVQGTS
ncbi:MAG: ABC transporter substrate-binding protein [Alphaproteobacteria bacterium]|nr:ABC transporter substrate-binding protein [Alphaproteobacteria bacterium]